MLSEGGTGGGGWGSPGRFGVGDLLLNLSTVTLCLPEPAFFTLPRVPSTGQLSRSNKLTGEKIRVVWLLINVESSGVSRDFTRCIFNNMINIKDRKAWCAAVHRVAKSLT